jgi:hypothetical protein
MDYLKLPIDQLRDDSDQLNRDWMNIEGANLSASQCYHLETNPPHFSIHRNIMIRIFNEVEGIGN